MEALATHSLTPWEPGLLSLFLYSFMVVILVAVLLFIAGWLGEKKDSAEKRRPYECGIIPTGSAQFAYPVPFYLVAAFFLIFDVEAAYIFSWAIAFGQLRWRGWFQITFFIFVLFMSLVYIWKKGGLDWRPRTASRSEIPKT
jgi:NADH-quinone oxidoreductase subunit A